MNTNYPEPMSHTDSAPATTFLELSPKALHVLRSSLERDHGLSTAAYLQEAGFAAGEDTFQCRALAQRCDVLGGVQVYVRRLGEERNALRGLPLKGFHLLAGVCRFEGQGQASVCFRLPCIVFLPCKVLTALSNSPERPGRRPSAASASKVDR